MNNPKSHIENMRLRNIEIGNKRRRINMGKILDKSATFPKGVTVKDIDQTFTDWVDNDLYVAFEGKVLPTIKMFSNQRISEYAQNWSHTDKTTGNILLNFKGVSKEIDSKKGENQGSLYNIPGDRDYVMGYKPVLQENGEEAYDVYTMKQPFTMDIMYTITLFTNKYDLVNEMNELMQRKFSALQVYIFPNGHAMPLTLEEVSDSSEHGVDDRRYYAISYKLKLRAYLVDPNGFKITHLPSRFRITTNTFKDKNKHKVKVSVEDWNHADECRESAKSPYENQNVNILIDFPSCHKTVDFAIDLDLTLEEVELHNVYDFVLYINEELQDLEGDSPIFFENGDNVHIEIERDDPFNESSIKMLCKNKNIIIDTRDNPESSLDETNFDLDIEIKNGESE